MSEHAERDRPVRAELRGQARCERRHDDHDRRHRQEPEGRRQGRVAEDELEVLRDQEHHAEHREEHEHHPAGAGAEAGVAEEPDVEHRLVDVQLPQHEDREHDERDRERAERRRRCSSPCRAPRSARRRASRCRRSTAPRRRGRARPAPGPCDFGTRNQPRDERDERRSAR